MTASSHTPPPVPTASATPATSPPATGQTGMYRIDRQDLPALEAAAKALGQAFFIVDLGRARNVPGFLKAMKRDLHFPEGFGNNLDALNDCLTDFSWHPATGYVIVLANSDALQTNPTSFATLNEVLAFVVDAWGSRQTPFRIFYLNNGTAGS